MGFPSAVILAGKQSNGISASRIEIELSMDPSSFREELPGRLSLLVKQLDVHCETKTKDNDFLTVIASVQYRALAEKAADAFYKFSNTKEQIQAYVFDVIWASVPKLDLFSAFEQNNEIVKSVKDELEKAMSRYGHEPDENVKKEMNEINAPARMRVAANEKAEAKKILHIKSAEGTRSKAVMDTILVIQYFDTMNAVVVYQSEYISILLALPCVVSIRHMVSDAEDLVSEMDKKTLEFDEYAQSALTTMSFEPAMFEKSWLRFRSSGDSISEGYEFRVLFCLP
ncbi:hypothetical protein POTOM_037716 [Populus tomentosa]|uniref:Band 7 domain-containing protein n=1 Tax=Populus tomentosa TaxID=118781 RepID=A0A8X7YUM8_POPTO|nr:hypothetical protein POTOM_037716 [Populus tomentosa]